MADNTPRLSSNGPTSGNNVNSGTDAGGQGYYQLSVTSKLFCFRTLCTIQLFLMIMNDENDNDFLFYFSRKCSLTEQ